MYNGKKIMYSGYAETVVISGANKESVSAYFQSESKSLILLLS